MTQALRNSRACRCSGLIALLDKGYVDRAVYPDGGSEILLRVPKYDFNWQPYYYLATPLKLPTGTRIQKAIPPSTPIRRVRKMKGHPADERAAVAR